MNLKNLFRLAILFCLLVCLCFCLCGCDEIDESSSARIRLYLDETKIDGDEVVCVVTNRVGEQSNLLDCTLPRSILVGERNAFVKSYEYVFTFDEAIYSAIENFIVQDGVVSLPYDDSRLKIVYDYVTIYKPVDSDGVTVNNDGEYITSFEITAPTAVRLMRDVPNRSACYAVAVTACTLSAGALATILVIRGKHGGRKEKPTEEIDTEDAE